MDLVLILPDDAQVHISKPKDASQLIHVTIDRRVVCAYRTLTRSLQLVISGVGTPHENSAEHIPHFPLLEILCPAEVDGQDAPTTIQIADLWAALNVFHTLYHEQETIPIIFSPTVSNLTEINTYLLNSGLARKRHTLLSDVTQALAEPEFFLLRETFWQGAGTVSYHTRGWLRGHAALLAGAPIPSVLSFTRTPLVIAAHPLRPPKPHQGETVYRKFFPSIGQMLELIYFDLDGQATGMAEDGVSLHLATFHRWHNSEHVNRGWGERGPLEKHRAYVRDMMTHPGVLPLMMSWDGELMGYAELVYIKENHVAQYVPGGAWDYDRGPHILVGELKFRGLQRSRAWFCGIHHFLFLSDPRTLRVIGEPKESNTAVIKLSEDTGMNLRTCFDFPYKRVEMTWLPRDRFFRHDSLAFATQGDESEGARKRVDVPMSKL